MENNLTNKENDIKNSNPTILRTMESEAPLLSLKDRLQTFRTHDTNVGKFNSPESKGNLNSESKLESP